MKKRFYYPILALPIYLLMLLPFPLLYLLSDFLYGVAFHLLGYRKKVVYTNLRNAFPGKTKKEIDHIARAYYHFMIDLFIETFKTLTVSKRQINKRMQFDDLSMIHELKAKQQNFLYVMGHYGNWEWCGHSFSLQHIYQLDALYHPLSNPFFDWLTNKIRQRFGMGLISMQQSVKEMIRRRDQLNATAFIADQTPSNPRDAYWMTFLEQDTPVFFGTEKIARKFNYPVVFVSVRRLKRGYYKVYFQKVTDAPKDTPEGYITETHTRMLEEEIRRQPEIWLWSHRRWKHKRPEGM